MKHTIPYNVLLSKIQISIRIFTNLFHPLGGATVPIHFPCSICRQPDNTRHIWGC